MATARTLAAAAAAARAFSLTATSGGGVSMVQGASRGIGLEFVSTHRLLPPPPLPSPISFSPFFHINSFASPYLLLTPFQVITCLDFGKRQIVLNLTKFIDKYTLSVSYYKNF
jgi:hypothetical protein